MKKITKWAARNNIMMRAAAHLKGWSSCRYFSESDSRYKFYAAYVPSNGRGRRPLIVAFHGMKGTIYEFVFTDVAKIAKEYGCIVACPGNGRSDFHNKSGERDVLEVIRDVKSRYNIDEERIYLIGISMGGRGATYVGFRNANLFAAIAAVYGTVTGEELIQLTLNGMKIRVFVAHGALDTVVPPDDSRELFKRLRTVGCECRFKVVEGLGHDPKVLDIVLPEIFSFFNGACRNRI